jgi:hypothetical protein
MPPAFASPALLLPVLAPLALEHLLHPQPVPMKPALAQHTLAALLTLAPGTAFAPVVRANGCALCPSQLEELACLRMSAPP